MFGIGFFELVVVGLVGLVVLGPERLPGAIRTASLWIGRLRRNFNSIKSDIEKEIGADEIRRQLRNEEIMEKFRNTQDKVQNSIKSIQQDAESFRKNVELEADAAAGKIAGPETGDTATGEAAAGDTAKRGADASSSETASTATDGTTSSSGTAAAAPNTAPAQAEPALAAMPTPAATPEPSVASPASEPEAAESKTGL